MNNNRLLVFISLVLIAIVLGEVWYLYKPTVIPIKKVAPTSNTAKKIQNEVIWRSLNKRLVASAILTRRFEGTITTIEHYAAEKEVGLKNLGDKRVVSYLASIRIVLTDSKQKEKHGLVYSKEELEGANFVLRGKKQGSVDVLKLKEGDNIIIEEETDLKSDLENRLVKLTITKI